MSITTLPRSCSAGEPLPSRVSNLAVKTISRLRAVRAPDWSRDPHLRIPAQHFDEQLERWAREVEATKFNDLQDFNPLDGTPRCSQPSNPDRYLIGPQSRATGHLLRH